MENSEFEEFENDLKNNKINWYPDKESVTTIENFDKTKIDELKQKVSNLKATDKILIFADNALSVKNICQKEDQNQNLFNKKELEKVLNEVGLTYKKFYYPLPSLNQVNVIFTDKHLLETDTVSRDIEFWENKEILKEDERKVLAKLLSYDKNYFKDFTNSYIIECSKSEFEDNQIEFVSYSNMRKKEYRIQTIIKGKTVYKTAVNEEAKNHINAIKNNIDILNKIGLKTLDSYDENTIKSSYQDGKLTLDKFLINLLKSNDKQKAYSIIQDFFENLTCKLEVVDQKENNVFDKYEIAYNSEDIVNLTFVKNGFWDAIFQNVFYIDNEFYFFDQEWFEENLPLEFILYRTVVYNSEIAKFFDLKELLQQKNITSKNIELFKALDEKLQIATRSEISWKYHINGCNLEQFIVEKNDRIKFLESEMTKTCELLTKTTEELNQRNTDLYQREVELANIKSSMYWKIKEKLNKLKK